MKLDNSEGMTLRDYFAAAALQGFMANPETGDNAIAIVRASYKIAEAMLKEREEC